MTRTTPTPSRARPREDAVRTREPALLSIAAAAAYLAIGVTTFSETVLPHVPKVRHGRRILVTVAGLDAWIAERVEEPLT